MNKSFDGDPADDMPGMDGDVAPGSAAGNAVAYLGRADGATAVLGADGALAPGRTPGGGAMPAPVRCGDVAPATGDAVSVQSEAHAGDFCPGHGLIRPYRAPAGLRLKRSAWVGPFLLASFVAAALAIENMLPRLTNYYWRFISVLSHVHSLELPRQASIAVRPFTVALLVLFAMFAAGSVRARVRLALIALAIYLPLMIVIDVALARLSRVGWPSPFTVRGNILDGIVGIVAAGIAFFSEAELPDNINLRPTLKRPIYFAVILAASVVATVISVDAISHLVFRHLRFLPAIPMLGGLLSAVVLFFSLLPVYLCAFSYLAGLVRPGHDGSAQFEPGVELAPVTFGFLVPAHNEEGRIGDCVRAIDAAAGDYPVAPTIYVIENGSTDATYAEARAALLACRHARGVLLTSSAQDKNCAKAHALNTGLAASTEQVIVRVDADTFVSQTLLSLIAPYFADPQVGGVGTLPLPHKVTTWIERMRDIEVYYGAGFKRSSQGAADAIPVLPGATVAFRRDALVNLGGFAEGMLGEDADITIRVGRLGYRIVSDPAIKVYSEQPQSLRELREQRMRWSGGLFHMVGRNRSTILRLQGLRGAWTMPWACFVMFRKLMLIPFAAAALALIALHHSLFPVREVAAAGAIALGAQLILMAVVVSLLGGLSSIVSLPSYLVFRLIVTYFALETLLTVRLKEKKRPVSLHVGHGKVRVLGRREAGVLTRQEVSAVGCTASVSSNSPAGCSTVAIYVQTAPGASVHAVARYKTTDRAKMATADLSGHATIAFFISGATPGYTVTVEVTSITVSGIASSSTSFTPAT